MSDRHPPLSRLQTLYCILIPMLATAGGLRLYLHLVQVQHIYPGGYLLHHLFTGVVIVIPAAFVLAFGTRRRSTAIAARVALGIGSGMVLDEITFLVMTKASDDDYVSAVSLIGGIVFIGLAVILLCLLYWLRRDA